MRQNKNKFRRQEYSEDTLEVMLRGWDCEFDYKLIDKDTQSSVLLTVDQLSRVIL